MNKYIICFCVIWGLISFGCVTNSKTAQKPEPQNKICGVRGNCDCFNDKDCKGNKCGERSAQYRKGGKEPRNCNE